MNPLLVAEGLSKFYGARIGCRNVSFALEPGEVLAIVGESGSGKTTLLNLLSGQLAPDSGAVRYWMRDGAPESPRSQRGRAPLPCPHRLGLRASGCAQRPAHGCFRRRQYRRAR